MTDDDKTVPYTPQSRDRVQATIDNLDSIPKSDTAREIADGIAADNANDDWAMTPEAWSTPDADENGRRRDELDWGGGVADPTAPAPDQSDQPTDQQIGPEATERYQPMWNEIDSTPASDLARDNADLIAADDANQDWAATPEDFSSPDYTTPNELEGNFDY